jgi:ferric-dicitrate binding protein FerR (iron transport regulator)
MSPPPDRHDELLALLGAIRDERITAAEFERLERLLAELPEARGLYLQYLTLHAALEQAGAADGLVRRVRETLRDEEIVRDLHSLLAAERQSGLSPRPRRSKARRYLAAAAMVAALSLVAVFLGQFFVRKASTAACSAEIAAVYGRVETHAAGGLEQAAPGTMLEPGRSLKTGPNACVRLRYPDGSTVDLNAAGELALLNGTRAKRLQLVTGTAYFAVSPQPSAAPLVVNPGQYDQVQVVGTRFQMNHDESGQSQVLVADGNVLFGTADNAVSVKARQTSVVQREQAPSQPEGFDPAAIWQGLSRGLTATYCDGEDLTGRSVTRIDPKIDFDWGKGSPDPAVGPDKFSVRWTGRVEAEHTEPYTFYVIADEGARLWIDGKLVIDAWENARGEKRESPPIDLVAGRAYDLKLEYHESQEKAWIQLLWSSPSTPRDVVPHWRLSPSP